MAKFYINGNILSFLSNSDGDTSIKYLQENNLGRGKKHPHQNN